MDSAPRILVYADTGAGNYVVKDVPAFCEDLAQTLDPIRQQLGFHTAADLRRNIGTVKATDVISGLWIVEPSKQILIMPGGYDMGYCKKLNGAGNEQIARFVELGGRYLGFCAGAYFASCRCVFDMYNFSPDWQGPDKQQSIVGDRELAFWPADAEGPFLGAYDGDPRHGETTALVAEVRLCADDGHDQPQKIPVFYNGGPVFRSPQSPGSQASLESSAERSLRALRRAEVASRAVLGDAAGAPRRSHAQAMKVLATYEQGGDAIVESCVGEGRVLLSAVHPEISVQYLSRVAALERGDAAHLRQQIIPRLMKEEYRDLLQWMVLRLAS